MLSNFSTFFKKYQRERLLAKRLRILENIPGNPKYTLCIAHNKELCEVKRFIELLDFFNHFKIEGYNLQQNINTNIISFRETIYDTCVTVSNIYKNLLVRNIDQVSVVARIARTKNPSFKFFNDKPNQDLSTFDQEALDQLIEWIRKIVLYFDSNKTNQEEFEEAFCSVTYQNLDVLYDFTYCLLCHVINIRCDTHKRISVFIEEDKYL